MNELLHTKTQQKKSVIFLSKCLFFHKFTAQILCNKHFPHHEIFWHYAIFLLNDSTQHKLHLQSNKVFKLS
jgi:hypothetical protein